MYQGTVGVGIISFDRPEYLGKLLRSLEENTDLEGTEFHLFQDGCGGEFDWGEGQHWGRVALSISAFEASALPVKFEHVREVNAGIAVNQFEAIEEMVGQYSHVVMVENDVVVSPDYLRLVRVLFEQLEGREDVFGFCLGFKKLCRQQRIEQSLDKIFVTCGHWWAECFWAERWAEVRPHYLEYYQLVRRVDYRKRPVEAIRALFRKKGWPSPVTTQDAAKDMAIYSAGLERVRTVVNRSVSIGERGVHIRPHVYRALGLGGQEPYIFEGDSTLERFEWRR